MNEEIFHSFASLGEEELHNINEVMQSRYLKGGVWLKRLQAIVAKDIGMADAIATHTGSLAIFLALKTLKLPVSSAIVVPVYICKSVVSAIRMANLIPLFCDVKYEDCSLDHKDIKKRHGESFAAIIVASLFGNSADVESMKDFNVPVIEDAVQCPCGKYLGAYSDMVVLSFEGTKMLCAGECGVLAVKNETLQGNVQKVISDGSICSLAPTDLQSAVAFGQWERRHEIIEKRRLLARRYNQVFREAGILSFGSAESLYSRFVIRECLNVSEMISAAALERINMRRPVDPAAISTASWRNYPVTSHLVSTNLSIPIFPDITEKMQEKIIHFILRNIKVNKEIDNRILFSKQKS